MPKYTVTFACGHTDVVKLTGPKRTREWMLKNKESELCPDCYKAQIEAKREEERAAALTEAEDQDLPALVGTEKQVAWAATIRQKFVALLDEGLQTTPLRPEIDKVLTQQAIESLYYETDAHWWIENGRIQTTREALTMLARRYGKLSKLQEAAGTATTIEDAKIEATVRPEVPITETIALIAVKDDVVEIEFPERNDTFREVVKGRMFRWSVKSWTRTCNQFTGPATDRAAEIGNLLLKAGIIIRIYDEAIRQKAIAGEYEPEYTRWISKRTGGTYVGWFAIHWERDNQTIYNAARAIAGSKWSSPSVVAPSSRFEAVLDLADEYGFKLSPGAETLIESARRAKEATLVVKPADGPAPIKGEPKEQTPEGEIDADLRDDD